MSQFPLIIPDISQRKPTTSTLVSRFESTVFQTRSKGSKRHLFTYKYSTLFSRQYRIINNFYSSMLGRATHFDLVHWGDIKQIKAISGSNITLDDVSDLTILTGRAGNKVLIWNGVEGDYGVGVGSTNLWTDANKSWGTNRWAGYILMDFLGNEFTIASNTANTLTVTGSPISGFYEIYQYQTRTITTITGSIITVNSAPMSYKNYLLLFILYDVFFVTDDLPLEPSGDHCLNWGPDYGPYYHGDIQFMQNGP